MLYRLVANGCITIGYYENVETAEWRIDRMRDDGFNWEFAIVLERV